MPRSIVGTVLAVMLAITVADVRAATFVVNTTADAVEGPCGTAAGECTLRDAILAAVTTPGRDTIAFDPSVFPIGTPGVIQVNNALRVIADPAGTVIDGAGAGVGIQPAPTAGIVVPDGPRGGPIPIEGLVFASAQGTPLEDVRVANITISGFSARGLVICGGLWPLCEDDVASTVLQNVVVNANQRTGIDIRGRNLSKTRIATTVATDNGGDGVLLEAAGALVGTRIERSTTRGNVADGFDLHPAGDAQGTVVRDSVSVRNGGHGLRLLAGGTVAKTKVTGSVAAENLGAGIQISGPQMIGVTIASVMASTNGGFGVGLSGGTLLSGAIVKDTVSNWNLAGIVLNSAELITGAKITKAKAAGNQDAGIGIGSDQDVFDSKVSGVFVAGNGAEGLRLRGSRNVVTRVRANGNRGHGIHLLANDDGNGVGNKLTKSSTFANDGHGIILNGGVTQSIVQKNSSSAADGFDLRDDNPACDANVWKQNVFVTRSPSCIQ